MHRFQSLSRSRLVGAVGFVFAMLLAASSQAQDVSGDSTALARYVPKDNVLIYFEYEGLDAHADAWKKTAAYKILNDTPTGVMLEEVAGQTIDKLASTIPGAGTAKRGQDLVTVIKHVAKSGFLFAIVGDQENPSKSSGIFVFRNAFKDKTVRAIMARNLSEMNAPNTKPQSVVRLGHKIISGVNTRGTGYAWWVEETRKEDIVNVFPSAEAADIFLETLDGKRPNALTNPQRVELAKPEGDFIPNGMLFINSLFFQDPKIPQVLGLRDVKKLDFRWGFQDEALMTITRITAPSPRKGLLGLLDGASFDKSKLPPIPESVSGFTVLSLDLKTTFDRLVAMAKTVKPDAEEDVNKVVNSIKAKTKLRLKEDVLAHIGPKVAWYVLPAKAAPAAAGPNLLGMMMASAGIDQVPKFALVFDIDDPKAFGKVLDEAMAALNRELKAQASQAMGDAAPARGRGNRGPSVPTFEFRLTGTDPKMYVLNVPPEMAAQIPSSIRPTIRVGPKHAVLAISPDVARMILETKTGWSAPADLKTAYQALPSKLKMLDVSDPRETLPALLASFPAKLQTAINSAILAKNPPGPGTGGAPNAPGAVVSPSPGGGGQKPMAAGSVGGGTPNSPPPGGPGPIGGSAAPGPNSTPAPGGSNTLVLQIDAAKLPKADSIKALLFPSLFSIEVTDSEIRIVSREAFPEIPDPSRTLAISQITTMMKGPGGLSSLFNPGAGAKGPAVGTGQPKSAAPGTGGGVKPGSPD